MSLQLKEAIKIGQLVRRVQDGEFDENDIDNLLIKLRPYGRGKDIFLEVSHFAAHADQRDRGLGQDSLTALIDSLRFLSDYHSQSKLLDLEKPFPSYIYRLLLSQTRLSDEVKLKAEFRMSQPTLMQKIKMAFQVDKRTGLYHIRGNKIGTDLYSALTYITSFIRVQPAFHINDFHKELKEVMAARDISFDEALWDAQQNKITLAVLCLISGSTFYIANEGKAKCYLATENHFRVLEGKWRKPNGVMSDEPKDFGKLVIAGEAELGRPDMPWRMSFSLIQTDLQPEGHCGRSLFVSFVGSDEFSNCRVQMIDMAPYMSLTRDFKLIRSDSISD